MKITKQPDPPADAEALTRSSAPGPEDLARINEYAKTPLTADAVYTFTLRLCDNEIDRDFERFDEAALSALGDLFSGRTGVFDHTWSAEGQTARIYRTELVREPETRTAAGDAYCYLKAWAYLLRTEKNSDLIAEIEGGIKKEVSIGCSVSRRICSVCGAEAGSCDHVPGREYNGRLCYTELRDPTDAYEWSFVAVPAQRKAGVLKRFSSRDRDRDRDRELELLSEQAAMGRRYLAALRRDVARLSMLAEDSTDGDLFVRIADRLEEPDLLALREVLEKQLAARFPVSPQLARRTIPPAPDSTQPFLV